MGSYVAFVASVIGGIQPLLLPIAERAHAHVGTCTLSTLSPVPLNAAVNSSPMSGVRWESVSTSVSSTSVTVTVTSWSTSLVPSDARTVTVYEDLTS